MTQLAVEVASLVKRYGDVTAVNGISFSARKGSCLGFLGPNGAGKTTTLETIEGLKRADSGSVRVLGMTWERDAAEIRQRIGVQLQETQFQEKLRVFEVVRLFTRLYRQGQPTERLLELVELRDKSKARVSELSGGQHQRLALACALANQPSLLFLDEPTTGLDPQARRRVWEVVENCKNDGRTVVLTTHYMDEAEKLADDLVIVDAGAIIAEGTPHSVIARMRAEVVVSFELVEAPAVDLATLGGLSGVAHAAREGAGYRLLAEDPAACIQALFSWAKRSELQVANLRTHSATLEDVFVELTGRGLRDGR